MRARQLPLYKATGNAYSRPTQARDLRLEIMRHFGDLFGSFRIEGEGCFDCGSELHCVAHPVAALIYCACGWWHQIPVAELL